MRPKTWDSDTEEIGGIPRPKLCPLGTDCYTVSFYYSDTRITIDATKADRRECKVLTQQEYEEESLFVIKVLR